jgi:hypothetical protein
MDIYQKQAERQQRGKDFEAEMRRSWAQVPNCWRMDISSAGGTRPADDIIILPDFNILAEYKRTSGTKFELTFLEPNQVTGLLNFEKVIPSRNLGLVFVSFLNEKDHLDYVFAFRLCQALEIMKFTDKRYITLQEMTEYTSVFSEVGKCYTDDGFYWRLKEALSWYKSQ